jgi:hypothetical protein
MITVIDGQFDRINALARQRFANPSLVNIDTNGFSTG